MGASACKSAVNKLFQVRNAAAVTLGYLTFNKTAARILFSTCRNMPGLYSKLIDNIGVDPHISPAFVNDFTQAKLIGLPCQWSVSFISARR